jgi:hypothetical protein
MGGFRKLCSLLPLVGFGQLAFGLKMNQPDDTDLAMIQQSPSKKQGLTPTEMQIGSSLISTAESMKPNLLAALSALQNQTDAEYSMIYTQCDRSLAAFVSDTTAQDAFQAAAKGHLACRQEEAALAAEVPTCYSQLSAMLALKYSSCSSAAALNKIGVQSSCTVQSGENFTNYASRLLKHYLEASDNLTFAQEQCGNSTQASDIQTETCSMRNSSVVLQRTVCNQNQSAMDSASCALLANSQSTCRNYTSCYSQATSNLLVFLDGVNTSLASLREQYSSMLKTVCLLQSVGGTTPQAYCSSPSAIVQEAASKMSIKFPVPKQATACKPAADTAGTPGYRAAQYSILPPGAPATTCTASCCPKCNTFACPQGSVSVAIANETFGSTEAECCTKARSQ